MDEISPPGSLGSQLEISPLCSAAPSLRLQDPLLKSHLKGSFLSVSIGSPWIGLDLSRLQCPLAGMRQCSEQVGQTFVPWDHYCQSRKGQSSCYRAKKLSLQRLINKG